MEKTANIKSRNENGFVFGTSGKGRAFHPWDYLKCESCGFITIKSSEVDLYGSTATNETI